MPVNSRVLMPENVSSDEFCKYGAMINFDELDNLVGQLLTYVDATYTDLEQRKAHKSIIKNIARSWYYECEESHPVKAKFVKGGNPNDLAYAVWDRSNDGVRQFN